MAINSNEKMINVLRFALEKSGIPETEYSIMKQADNKLCLEQKNNVWIIYFRERGTNFIDGSFSHLDQAANFFFWRLVLPPKFTSFLKEYEKSVEET